MCRSRSPSELQEMENLIVMVDAFLANPRADNHLNLFKFRQRLREEEENGKEKGKRKKEKENAC